MLFLIVSSTATNAYTIQEIEPEQAEQAKAVMMEVFGKLIDEAGGMTHAELEQKLDDVYRAQQTYFDDRGTFLVILDDDNNVVGTGALTQFNNTTGEIKRITLLAEHRGHGLGTELVEALLDKARKLGYSSVVLEVFYPDYQQAAIQVYKKLGFKEVPHYRIGTAAGLSLGMTL
jgi:RimJ/RimL family protein N-acetyltransferase